MQVDPILSPLKGVKCPDGAFSAHINCFIFVYNVSVTMLQCYSKITTFIVEPLPVETFLIVKTFDNKVCIYFLCFKSIKWLAKQIEGDKKNKH